MEAREKRGEEYWRGRAAAYDRRLTRLRDDQRPRQSARHADRHRRDEDGRLHREQAEASAALQEALQNLSFLRTEFEDFQAFAARKDVDPEWLR